MKTRQVAAAVTSLALLTTACENLTPGENAGLFGAAAGLATGIPLAVAGVDPAITIPVTAGAVAVAAASAYIISKHQATERQRKIAEQRARLYLRPPGKTTGRTAGFRQEDQKNPATSPSKRKKPSKTRAKPPSWCSTHKPMKSSETMSTT